MTTYTLNAIAALTVLGLAGRVHGAGVWATPHDSYSSSIGVLGCKINTDRVAYWPGSVDCNNICVKLSYGGRSVHLLRIDQSGGAYDISYDAWNYLQTGKSAATDPIAGGPIAMESEEVDASACASLIYTPGNKLPLSAANSINFLSSCLAQPNSWVAKNHVLYNICDPICTLGHDEECRLNLAVSNQPACPHTLGLTSKLSSAPVYNILYQTGKTVVAGTGEVATPKAKTPAPAPAPAPAPVPAPGYTDKDSKKAPPPPPSPTSSAVEPPPPSTATGAIFKENETSRPHGGAAPTSAPVAPPAPVSPAGTPDDVVPSYSGAAPLPSDNTTVPAYGKPTGPSTTFAMVTTATGAQAAAGASSTRDVVSSSDSGLFVRGGFSALAVLAGTLFAMGMHMLAVS